MLVRSVGLALVCWTTFLFSGCSAQESPEAIFRRTVSLWQKVGSMNDWSPWHEFCDDLWGAFTIPLANNRLDIVGALEEGILAIERVVFQHEMGENQIRDIALSKLYTTYAKTLMNLDASECLTLASDPHTLLIGADTYDKTSPSTHLCVANAENSLRNAASLDATNLEALKLIQEITDKEESTHNRKSNEFVAELFNSFADTFDDKLLNTLEYKVPRLVGELAMKLASTYNAVMDAGCGTGLAGRYIRPLVPDGPIVGVDVSQKMLDKAKLCTVSFGCGLPIRIVGGDVKDPSEGRALYDGLVKMDLEAMTVQKLVEATGISTLKGFDLVVAADVMVYFGSLDHLLETFASISLPGGRLIFSCEFVTIEEAPSGWRLLPHGRFGHAKNYVVESAKKAGYLIVHYEEIIPRTEKGEPVRGHLFAFELMDEGGGDNGGGEL
jgi:predicted TPR repeat methyltransferase